MARLWKNTPETPEGKYLVKRRDGTVPRWPFIVLAGSDPAAPAASRAEGRAAGAGAGAGPPPLSDDVGPCSPAGPVEVRWAKAPPPEPPRPARGDHYAVGPAFWRHGQGPYPSYRGPAATAPAPSPEPIPPAPMPPPEAGPIPVAPAGDGQLTLF